MDKRLATECIKSFEDINFIEKTEGNHTIGYIKDDSQHKIKVQYLDDNLGKYILSCLMPLKRKAMRQTSPNAFQNGLSTADMRFLKIKSFFTLFSPFWMSNF